MIFLFRPYRETTDEAEKLAHEFAEDILERLNDDEVIDFSIIRDIKKFKEEIEKYDSNTAFLAYCHGSTNNLHVYSRGDVSIKKEDARIFRKKFCYLAACYALAGLGEAMKDAGADGVVGYNRTVWIPIFYPEYRKVLKHCINSGIIHWLKYGGNSCEIYNIVKNAYHEELEKLDSYSDVEFHILWIYGVLRSNLASLGYF